MAKTRIKTTPTRLQKDALAAEDIKKRLRQANITQETKGSAISLLNVTSSVLVAPPKRTSSMSSASSIVSLTNGDSLSTNTNSNDQPITSESITTLVGSSSPNSPHSNSIGATGEAVVVGDTTTTTPTIATKTINCQQLNNRKKYLGNNFMLRNRKVFMITEHCDDQQRHDLADASTGIGKNGTSHQKISSCSGQKRKMYLIMEETPTQQQLPYNDSTSTKFIKNEFNGNATKKKLTLFADRCDAHLTQKFEQILPEIIHRINNTVRDRATTTTIQTTPVAIVTAEPTKRAPTAPKATTPTAPTTRASENDQNDDENAVYLSHVKHEKSLSVAADDGVGASNGVIVGSASPSDETPDEPSKHVPITLPPKKNRMKIINTAASGQCLSAATPVIVSTAQALSSSRYNTWSGNGNTASLLQTQSPPPHQKNINLSTDFLFLMKMLPKLEAIPEPHKNHVKNCIEKIVTQNAGLFQEQ